MTLEGIDDEVCHVEFVGSCLLALELADEDAAALLSLGEVFVESRDRLAVLQACLREG